MPFVEFVEFTTIQQVEGRDVGTDVGILVFTVVLTHEAGMVMFTQAMVPLTVVLHTDVFVALVQVVTTEYVSKVRDTRGTGAGAIDGASHRKTPAVSAPVQSRPAEHVQSPRRPTLS